MNDWGHLQMVVASIGKASIIERWRQESPPVCIITISSRPCPLGLLEYPSTSSCQPNNKATAPLMLAAIQKLSPPRADTNVRADRVDLPIDRRGSNTQCKSSADPRVGATATIVIIIVIIISVQSSSSVLEPDHSRYLVARFRG
jgi:hypothetical protein